MSARAAHSAPEVGYLSYGTQHADLMFDVINRRASLVRSTVVTTNKPFQEWNDVFPNSAAVVDAPEAQRLLLEWLVKVAGQRIHGTTKRKPIEVFDEEEKAQLLPLPSRRWSPILWRKVSVHRDCHVQIDGAFYSVP